MKRLEVKLRTLTPLWTGGVDGKSDRVHETGIIGSLRWWYEALLRGVGGRVCNTVGNVSYRPSNRRQPDNPTGKCQLDSDHLSAKLPTDPARRRDVLYEAGLCDVCQMFGTTGWRRRFRISIDGNKLRPEGPRGALAANRSYVKTDRYGRTQEWVPKWYFKSQALGGLLQIQVVPTGDEDVTPVIAGLLQFIADWSALGARPQLGFGVVRLQERVDSRPLHDRLALAYDPEQAPYHARLPNLRNLFFIRMAVPSNDWKEVLNLKYDLRQLFAGSANRDLRHTLFGTVRGTRIASKVRISAPYGDPPMMRVWGWTPAGTRPNSSIRTIHTHLSGVDPNLTWRQFDNVHDTVHRHTDPLEFLTALLAGKEGI